LLFNPARQITHAVKITLLAAGAPKTATRTSASRPGFNGNAVSLLRVYNRYGQQIFSG
jgi:hypothetical protein